MKPSEIKRIFHHALIFFLIFFPAASVSGEDTDKITDIHIATPLWEGQTNKDGTGLFFDIVRSVYEPAGLTMK